MCVGGSCPSAVVDAAVVVLLDSSAGAASCAFFFCFPSSSRYPSFNCSGTLSSPSPSTVTPFSRHISHHSLITVSFVFPPAHPSQTQPRLFRAHSLLTASLVSNPPTCPLTSPFIKLRIAIRAVRIPHAGCQLSSWCPEMLRQISRLTSKRPEGVRKRKEGGRRGYVDGRTMRPW